MSLTIAAIFWGIVTFSLLVVLHEGGHMLVARAFGVKVHEFFIGLPGPSLSFQAKGTRYGVTAIPLGGYVRISGMEGDTQNLLLEPVLCYLTVERHADLAKLAAHFNAEEDEIISTMNTLEDWSAVVVDTKGDAWSSAFEQAEAESPDSLMEKAQVHTFLALKTWQRVAVLSSGVVVNIVTALAVFTIVLSGWGYYSDLGHIDPVKGGPAYSAGLKANDKITAIDGKSVVGVSSIAPLLASSYNVGERVNVQVSRSGKIFSEEVELGSNPTTKKPYLGVQSHMTHVKSSVGSSLAKSFGYVGLTFKALAGFFNPRTFKASAAQSSSIVGISVMAAKAAETSALDYIWLIAAISLSLGIMNILPIPPLDGGKIAIELFAGIRKKPVSMKVQTGLSLAGFALLFLLVIVLTVNDFSHILG
ncbi:MAG: site-2 protease family protein [Coriobacteriia bacterium]|nr:site-2 protease family protein [Coriobacteriia bacterium]